MPGPVWLPPVVGDPAGMRAIAGSLRGTAEQVSGVDADVGSTVSAMTFEGPAGEVSLLEIFEGRLATEDATTLAEIAARFGVSRERVRQLEERLKQRLRRYLQASLGDAVPMTATPARAHA